MNQASSNIDLPAVTSSELARTLFPVESKDDKNEINSYQCLKKMDALTYNFLLSQSVSQ